VVFLKDMNFSLQWLGIGCPKNPRNSIFAPTRTFRVFRILDLKTLIMMLAISDPSGPELRIFRVFSGYLKFGTLTGHTSARAKVPKSGRRFIRGLIFLELYQCNALLLLSADKRIIR
jgi:hypothetical protein